MSSTTSAEVVAFWREAGPGRWFQADAAFDAAIRERFEATHHAAARRELDTWSVTAEGALALLILLDQFPRNLFRGSPHQFATDPLARAVAREAADRQLRPLLEPELARFFSLPFQHSEDIADQDFGVSLAEQVRDDTGDADPLNWAEHHRRIIRRFGRFPHRNAMLGRVARPGELTFLEEGGFDG